MIARHTMCVSVGIMKSPHLRKLLFVVVACLACLVPGLASAAAPSSAASSAAAAVLRQNLATGTLARNARGQFVSTGAAKERIPAAERSPAAAAAAQRLRDNLASGRLVRDANGRFAKPKVPVAAPANAQLRAVVAGSLVGKPDTAMTRAFRDALARPAAPAAAPKDLRAVVAASLAGKPDTAMSHAFRDALARASAAR